MRALLQTKKHFAKFILAFFLLAGSLVSNHIFAAEWYEVAAGASVTVDEHGICWVVTNSVANPTIYVPTKTLAEWEAFISGHPVSVTLSACTSAPVISLNANPTSVDSGNYSAITWSTTDATSCTASNGWSGAKATSGGENRGPISSQTTFTLTCTGPGGSAVESVTVSINVPQCNDGSDNDSDGQIDYPADPGCSGQDDTDETDEIPPPTVDLDVNGQNNTAYVDLGGIADLSWSVTGATSCTASGDWSGSKSTGGGSSAVFGIDEAKTFYLDCTGPGGSASSWVWVYINFPTVTMDANEEPYPPGSTPVITVTATNATSCELYKDYVYDQSFTPPANLFLDPIYDHTYYHADCTGPSGSAWDAAWIQVSGPGNPSGCGEAIANWGLQFCNPSWFGCTDNTAVNYSPSAVFNYGCLYIPLIELSADPENIGWGESSDFTWTTSYATSCEASQGWSGSKSVSGSETVGPITTTDDYILSCDGPGGSGYDQVVVNVIN